MFGKCGLLKASLLAIFLLLPLSALAAKDAVIITDGAMVYKEADFDSAVIGYFQAGDRVRVSDRVFEQAFHRVRLKQGVIGYIADVDFKAKGQPGTEKQENAAEKEPEAETKPEVEKKNRNANRPIGARTYLGVVFGYSGYSEIIGKTEYKTKMMTYGAKFTAPVRMGDGPFFLDIQSSASFSPPEYYNGISATKPKGYFFINSASLLFPLAEFSARRGLMYFGGGLVVNYSYFQIENSGSKLELEEVRAGAVFVGGFAFQMGSPAMIFKIEPRYYLEKTNYFSLDASIQFSL